MGRAVIVSLALPLAPIYFIFVARGAVAHYIASRSCRRSDAFVLLSAVPPRDSQRPRSTYTSNDTEMTRNVLLYAVSAKGCLKPNRSLSVI